MPQYRNNPIERTQPLQLILEEKIVADSEAHFIDFYIDQLDLASLGFSHTTLAKTGRRPYKLSDLLKLIEFKYKSAQRFIDR